MVVKVGITFWEDVKEISINRVCNLIHSLDFYVILKINTFNYDDETSQFRGTHARAAVIPLRYIS